jgi:hypothetical protein
MVLGKFEAIFSMMSLEKRALLFDNRAKATLLEYIPDCLGTDRIGKDAIDEIGSLNSIVKLASSDLANDRLFVTRGKLGRVATLVVFLGYIGFFLDSTNGRLPYTGFRLNITKRIAFMKKREDCGALGSRDGMHGGGGKERSD